MKNVVENFGKHPNTTFYIIVILSGIIVIAGIVVIAILYKQNFHDDDDPFPWKSKRDKIDYKYALIDNNNDINYRSTDNENHLVL